MKVLQFDSVGGASGSMVLGALFELGVSRRAVVKELCSLPIERFEIETEPFHSHGLRGTRVGVRVDLGRRKEKERTFADIRDMIAASKLTNAVKHRCLNVFLRLAEAEASVHGVEVEDVHFHEVGAVDSIVDIVGSCIAIEQLGVKTVSVGPLPLGTGTVECRHGTYPVPAPATVELLKGHPVEQTTIECEMVTPTGAAILMTWKTATAAPRGSRVLATGCGFGHHAMETRPNVLRATLLEAPEISKSRISRLRKATAVLMGRDTSVRTAVEPPPGGDVVLVLECNIDDTVPELLGALVQQLMSAGALDVFSTAVQMKKQRPGTLLTVLCEQEKKEEMLDLIFRESTTFGVREQVVGRTKLDRRIQGFETPYGPVRVKIGTWRGQDVTFAPEMDDCVKLAGENGVSVRTVYESAARLAHKGRSG